MRSEQISPIRLSFVASLTKGLDGASNELNSGNERGRTTLVSWLSMNLTSIVVSQIAALSLSRLQPRKWVGQRAAQQILGTNKFSKPLPDLPSPKSDKRWGVEGKATRSAQRPCRDDASAFSKGVAI